VTLPEPSSASSEFRDAGSLAHYIQSTLISNCVTSEQWERHIRDCLQYQFHAAMIPPAWVRRTADTLRNSGVRVASFIDFPLGTMTSAGKAREAASLVQEGVEEIDLMPNVGFLLSGMEKEYFEDIRGVVASAAKIPVKIMLELPLLTTAQSKRAVSLGIDAGAAYLKNASGGAVGVATPEQIRFLRNLAPPEVRIKASGGIKTAQQVRELIAAGADLVGTSCALQIIRGSEGSQTPSQESSSSY